MAHDHLDRDLYEVLGVASTASPAEITSAYRRRVRDLHPDSREGDATADATGLADVFAAYRVLRDPEQRASYDASGRQDTRRHRPVGGVRIPVRYIERDPPSDTTTWLRAGPVGLDPQPSRGAGPAPRAARFEPPPDLLRVMEALFRRWW